MPGCDLLHKGFFNLLGFEFCFLELVIGTAFDLRAPEPVGRLNNSLLNLSGKSKTAFTHADKFINIT